MALTIDDICTRVRLRAGESVTSPTRYFGDDAIVQHINYLTSLIEEELTGYNSPLVRTKGSIAITASDASSGALPSDFAAIAGPWACWKDGYADDPIEYNNDLRELQVYEDYNSTSDNTEGWVITDDDTLKVFPPVASSTTFWLEYYKTQSTLSTVTDALPFGYKFQAVYEEGTLVLCYGAAESKVDVESQLYGLVSRAAMKVARKNRPALVTL